MDAKNVGLEINEKKSNKCSWRIWMSTKTEVLTLNTCKRKCERDDNRWALCTFYQQKIRDRRWSRISKKQQRCWSTVWDTKI